MLDDDERRKNILCVCIFARSFFLSVHSFSLLSSFVTSETVGRFYVVLKFGIRKCEEESTHIMMKVTCLKRKRKEKLTSPRKENGNIARTR